MPWYWDRQAEPGLGSLHTPSNRSPSQVISFVEKRGVPVKQELGVVVVTFNSAAVVGDALQSIDEDVDCIVVDNCSSDESVARAIAHGAQVIRLETNVGFGKACNIGARALTTPFILFLNPDARLRPGALRRLVEAATEHPEWAAVNPKLVTSRGDHYYRRRSLLLPPDANERLRQPPRGRQEVVMISGAALLVRRVVFEELGGFDEKIFMYFEDDDLAVRLRQAGWKLGYVGDAIVEHIGGFSSDPTPELQEFKAYHLMRSTLYATAKHRVEFNRTKRFFTCCFKWAIAACRNATIRKAKYRGFIRALLEV